MFAVLFFSEEVQDYVMGMGNLVGCDGLLSKGEDAD